MDLLGQILPLILYLLGSILLIVLIILGIKLIKTMNKVDNVVNDINTKVQSLNGFFGIIDFATDKLSLFTDRFVDGLSSLIGGIFSRLRPKKKNKKKEEEENE